MIHLLIVIKNVILMIFGALLIEHLLVENEYSGLIAGLWGAYVALKTANETLNVK